MCLKKSSMEINSSTLLLNVLLADHNAEHRFLFEESLKSTHVPAKLVAFDNGSELISHLDNCAEEIPDFIFLELHIPRPSGKECLKEIRKRTLMKYSRVIICSQSTYKKDIEETFRLGADLFLPKQVLSQDTLHKIFSLLWQNDYSGPIRESFVLYRSEENT